MFGYVLPLKKRLREEEFLRYRAAYCGLCQSLKEQYGGHCRFLVNYDMTFLYFLLSREKEEYFSTCFCPARPFCKRPCMPHSEVLEYTADLTVLLSWWKLADAEQDGHGLKSLGARLAMLLYRRAYRRAAAKRPREDGIFRTRLDRLHKLEGEKCPGIDPPADAFASMLKACAPVKDERERRILETLLYHVGRYLYLVDALEDLPKDLKTDSYNPLRYRYHLTDQGLTSEDLAELRDSIEGSISLAASALELLEAGENTEILHNIIYFGLPAVLESVSSGSFRKRRSKHEGSL